MQFGTATELIPHFCNTEIYSFKNEHFNMPVYSGDKRQTNDL